MDQGPAPTPLAGLKVLDMSRVVSGPFAGRMMSDLGADVVKLEPPDGDVTRLWGKVVNGLSGFYTQQNTGKRNICADLRRPEAVSLVRRLAGAADVVIENFRSGVMDRLGLGYAALSADHPRLVMLSISGFGADGPGAGRAAYAPVIHAESGLIARQAEFDRASPSDPMLSIADTNAALHGLVGVLAALLQRDATGRGDHVRISMLESMLATDDYAHHALDRHPIERLGGEVWSSGCGPVLIAGEFRFLWRQLSTVLGVVDPTPPGAELQVKIRCRRSAAAEWFASVDDRARLIEALDAAGLAWADVRPAPDAFDSPDAAGAWVEVDDRGGGTRRVVRSPYRFGGRPTMPRRGAPHRGEHNAEVMSEWLGLPSAEADRLKAAGVLLGP